MKHISQEDAVRAIELLVRFSDKEAGFQCREETLDDDLSDFLYDDSGDLRFEERDPSPNCRCEECPMGGPYTCISED